MRNTYEGQYIVNSFYAVNAETKEIVTANEAGFISLAQGDTIIFKSIYNDEYVPVNTLIVFAGSTPVKLQLNDNTVYPFYVEAGVQRGISNMMIHSFTALNACTLYYEGIVC